MLTDWVFRIAAYLINPVPWVLILFLLLMISATKKRGGLRFFCILFVAVLWAAGLRPVLDRLSAPLDGRYTTPKAAALKKLGVKRIVVLTGGGWPQKGEIVSSAFPHGSAYRLMGALELASRLGSECQVVFSGSAGRSARDVATADMMREYASTIMPSHVFASETKSGSTAEHPANVKPLVGKEPFALVTSAYHMPRAMRAFEKEGLKPVPYPVDRFILGGWRWSDWVPSLEVMWGVQVILREHAATLVGGRRGKG
jgi:uncharacterized SAM-binding protein YcdF (DUF218 family)